MTIYSNSKIYRIIDNTNGQQYFGSTKVGLSQRMAQHNYSFKRWKCGKTNYTSSYKILENGDYNIILVEEFPCENKEQLRRRERFHIESNLCVNIRKPLQTCAELHQYHQQYRAENRTDLYAKQKDTLVVAGAGLLTKTSSNILKQKSTPLTSLKILLNKFNYIPALI